MDISEFSVRPPHRDRVTSGRSLAESERHSVPLSAAALPTDWGDCEPEHIPESIQCLAAASDSLGRRLNLSTTFIPCFSGGFLFLDHASIFNENRSSGRIISSFVTNLLGKYRAATSGSSTFRSSRYISSGPWCWLLFGTPLFNNPVIYPL